MNKHEKARTAVQRVQKANRKLKEERDPGAALRDALAVYDEHSGDYCRHIVGPEGPCSICDAPALSRSTNCDPFGHHSHVHMTWNPNSSSE